MEQVTVYADIQTPELMHHVSAAATALLNTATICTVPLAEAANPLAFLKLWEAERDDVWSYVDNNVPLMHRFECFVTESKSKKDGVVSYALYYRHMPVLSLAAAVTCGAGVEQNDGGDAEGEDSDWITTTLYNTVFSLGCSSSVDAITAFFTFPATFGKALAVEGECADFVLGQCKFLCDYMRREWNVPVHLVGPSFCDLAANDGDDMGPKFAEERTSGGKMHTFEEIEEEENALYASLIFDLLNVFELKCVYQTNLQLHGALSALNRHHNLRIFRYRLQRGANIIVCRPLSFVFERLVRDCGEKKMFMETARKVLADIVKSIQKFEFYWLGVYKPEVLVLLDACNYADTSMAVDMNMVTTSTRWTSCFFGNGDLPIGDVLSDWRLVKFCAPTGDAEKELDRLRDALLDVARSTFASQLSGEHCK